jgi:hypothetical protein
MTPAGTRGRRVLVTGGTGFLGTALVRRLLSSGIHVRILARSATSAKALADAGAEIVVGDITDTSAAAWYIGRTEKPATATAPSSKRSSQNTPLSVPGCPPVAERLPVRVLDRSQVGVDDRLLLRVSEPLASEAIPLAPACQPTSHPTVVVAPVDELRATPSLSRS